MVKLSLTDGSALLTGSHGYPNIDDDDSFCYNCDLCDFEHGHGNYYTIYDYYYTWHYTYRHVRTNNCTFSSMETSFFISVYGIYSGYQDAIMTVSGNINNDVHCEYSNWTNWGNCESNGNCDGTIGFGTQKRTRTPLDLAPPFGHQCDIEKAQSRECNLNCPGTF